MVYGVELENGTVIYPRDNSTWLVIRPGGSHAYYNDPVILIICECFGGKQIRLDL